MGYSVDYKAGLTASFRAHVNIVSLLTYLLKVLTYTQRLLHGFESRRHTYDDYWWRQKGHQAKLAPVHVRAFVTRERPTHSLLLFWFWKLFCVSCLSSAATRTRRRSRDLLTFCCSWYCGNNLLTVLNFSETAAKMLATQYLPTSPSPPVDHVKHSEPLQSARCNIWLLLL